MTHARWDRIKDIFNAALGVPQADRPALLDRLCADDAEIRREVESLLEARTISIVRTGGAADALGDLTTASITDPHAADRVGMTIHRYKLLQIIGEGGFGTVYLAEQTEPVRRRVALKVIKPGMDSRAIVARFEAERQALAMMDHPHIARVLDGGVTPLTDSGGGLPYFVMEYVVGDPVIAFADAHALSIAERLDLFQQICSAVQHAHTKGIIHRDLKPGNVIVSRVDGKAFAKVIDFGIAKATGAAGGRLTDKTFFTEHRQLIGTPEYMSPEQAEGSIDIDTRTDVYALGVLLYELLTGTTPIDSSRLRSAAFGEMQRIIREEEPLAPSMKLSRSLERLASTAATRKAEPSKLSAMVKGELDWIVLKALEKDRSRRYETATALADDVKRHMAGEPVVAAPPSRAYQLRKFVRKNKGAVVGMSAVMLALAAGGTAAAWQWKRAEGINKVATELAEQAGFNAAQASLARERAEVQRDFAARTARALEDTLRGDFQSEDRREVNRIIDLPDPPAGPYDPEAAKTDVGGSLKELARSTLTAAEAAERQRAMIQNALVSLYQPGTVVDTMGQAATAGYLAGIRKSVAYQRVLPEDRAVWEVAELSKFMTRQYEAQLDAATWSAYTANLALAQAAVEAGNWVEARSRVADCPESKRGWEWAYTNMKAKSIEWCIVGEFCEPRFSSDGQIVQACVPDSGGVCSSFQYFDAVTGTVLTCADSSLPLLVALPSDNGDLVTTVANESDLGPEHNRVAMWPQPARRLASRIIPGDPWSTNASFSQDASLVVWSQSSVWTAGNWRLCVARVDQWGGPEISLDPDSVDLRTSAMLADTDPTPSGLSVRVPDTTRVITAEDRAIRFSDAGSGRELAVFRTPAAITNLQMTGDGTRLIIRLADGSARVWDIRDPAERRKDLEAERAERVPAGAYLDELWGSDTPDDKLRDTIARDASLTPLRRLVAVEMLEERLEETRTAVDQVMETITAGQTDKAAVVAAADAADLPMRVKAAVQAQAAQWLYKPTVPSTEVRLAEEERSRKLAEARLVVAAFRSRDAGGADDAALNMLDLPAAVRVLETSLGQSHAETIDALLVLAMEQSWGTDAKLALINQCIERRSQCGDAVSGVDITLWSYRATSLWARGDLSACLRDMRAVATHLEDVWVRDRLRIRSVVYIVPSSQYNGPGQTVDEVRERARSLAMLSVVDLYRDLSAAPSTQLAILERLGAVESTAMSPQQLLVLTGIRHNLSIADDRTLAAAAEIDAKPGSLTNGRALTRDEHLAAAREALAKARALMLPASDGTPSRWANDEDIKALLAEAEALLVKHAPNP